MFREGSHGRRLVVSRAWRALFLHVLDLRLPSDARRSRPRPTLSLGKKTFTPPARLLSAAVYNPPPLPNTPYPSLSDSLSSCSSPPTNPFPYFISPTPFRLHPTSRRSSLLPALLHSPPTFPPTLPLPTHPTLTPNPRMTLPHPTPNPPSHPLYPSHPTPTDDPAFIPISPHFPLAFPHSTRPQRTVPPILRSAEGARLGW